MIKKFNPCSSGLNYYISKPSFEAAWNDCQRGDWMLWIAEKLDVDYRLLTLAKGKCAETVVHLMKDERSINAMKTAIDFGSNIIDEVQLEAAYADADTASAAAHAGYDADHAASAASAAAHAGYAAGYAAAHAAYAAAYAAAHAYTDAAYAAAKAAHAAAYAAAHAYADAAYAAAKAENQLQTANICRKILTNEVFSKLI